MTEKDLQIQELKAENVRIRHSNALLEEELKEYRELEEQGLLPRLKCNKGNRFFCVWLKEKRGPIQQMEVTKVEIHGNKMIYFMEFVSNRGSVVRVYEDDFGQIVFKTKQEAEQALEKLKGE